MSTVWGNSFHFRLKNGRSWESIDFFETENISTQEELEPQIFRFMPNDLPVEVPEPDICYPMFSNTGFVGRVIFVCKVNIWNVNYARATAFIFRLKNGCSWQSIDFFETENISTQGELEPPIFRFMPNALPVELPEPDTCCPMFSNTGSGGHFRFQC